MKKPVISIIIIILNLAVLGYMYTQSGESDVFSPRNPVIQEGAKVNSAIINGEVYRLLTSIFIHLSIIHILMNMFILWQLGSVSEMIWNKFSFILIYFGSGLIASLTSFAFSKYPSAGASGAVFGLAGALLSVKYFTRDGEIPFPKQAIGSIGVFVLYNIIFGLSRKGIDNSAHIGGLVSGAIIGYALLPGRNPVFRLILLGAAAGIGYFLYMTGMARFV